MRTIRDIADLKDKKILMRVDFDVPVSKSGEILERFRIEKQKDTLDYLANHGAKVILVGHIKALDSFAELIPQIHMSLTREIGFIADIAEVPQYLSNYPEVGLLENIRRWPGEEQNLAEFAEQLSGGFDYYVNNAFAVSHREHASVSAIASFLPAYAGFQLEAEVLNLKEIIEAPAQGKVVIMGGAKASTKVPVIKNFLPKADAIITGGVIANDILKAKGQDVGPSVVDEDAEKLLTGVDLNDPKLGIPEDFVIDQGKILDIGDKTIEKYSALIAQAKLIVWNGPMGLFEDPKFLTGTEKIAHAIVSSGAKSVIGGGDTIQAVDQLGLLNRFSFVSTGGGAMLKYLAGEELPGLKIVQ